MFSPSQAFRFAAPIPPTPIAAMFSLLLGASAPSTRRGTMAAESAARAEVEVNCLRDTVFFGSLVIAQRSYSPPAPRTRTGGFSG